MPKISIIIPVYNAEQFLPECLNSVTEQTLEDIEILCIDDASTDSSLRIIKDYAERDSRIKVIAYEQNKSASQARKDGALAAAGEYILFLDGDDFLELNACEELYEIITKEKADIVHFGTRVLDYGANDHGRVSYLEKFLRPYDGKLCGSEVFSGCFIEKKYRYSIWNKIYSSELCAKAFSLVQDGSFPSAQDLYAFYILTSYANSYFGVPNKIYHNYRFGAGFTGNSTIDLAKMKRLCTSVLVADAIKAYSKEFSTDISIETVAQIRNDLLIYCLNNWYRYLPDEYAEEGFDLLVQYWNKENLVAALCSTHFNDKKIIAQKVFGAKSLQYRQEKKIKTIGIFYHRYALGGVQRVISLQIPMYISMGYKVVLFTDECSEEKEYHLPDEVVRVVLPSSLELKRDEYKIRASAFAEALRENNIDMMHYHAASSGFLLFDMLLVKLHNIPFIISSHENALENVLSMNIQMATKPYVFKIADKMTVLSKMDEKYWRALGVNAVYVSNPIESNFVERDPDLIEKNTILWINRLDLRQKRYMDTIEIMKEVVKEIPDAKLLIVGNEVTSNAFRTLENSIERNNLKNNIFLCGETTNVNEYYQRASVHIITSIGESFSMTIAESKAYGMPLVMYELPYLELLKDNKGFFSVEQGNMKAMAHSIVTLLNDDLLRKKIGEEAKESLAGFIASLNLRKAWQDIIDSLQNNGNAMGLNPKDEDFQLFLHCLLTYHEAGCKDNNAKTWSITNRLNNEKSKHQKKLQAANKKIKTLQKKLSKIQHSFSYRLARLFTAPLRTVRRLLKRQK